MAVHGIPVAATLIIALLARLLLPPRNAPASVASGTVQELHARLRKELSGPVELWGVRVASGSIVSSHEAAVLSSFLKARRWDVDDTTYMFKEYVRWRKEFGVGKLRADQFGDLPNDVFRGRTSTGKLICVLRLGDLKGEAFNDKGRFLRWRVFIQESLNSQLDFGKGVPPHYTLVLDCEGFSTAHFGKAARRCATELSRVFQDYYPDFLDQIVVCNPPPIFTFAFRILRPFLPRNFVKIIKVHPGDQASCLEKLGRKRDS